MNIAAMATNGDTSSDDDSSGSRETVAPAGYHLSEAEGPLDADGSACSTRGGEPPTTSRWGKST